MSLVFKEKYKLIAAYLFTSILFLLKGIPSFAQHQNLPINDSIIAALPPNIDVIGLGDPTHQESTITTYRIDLIKKLVTQKGFKVIAIEGNIYELYKAHTYFLKDADVSHYEKAMYPQLNAVEMKDLYQFVYNENKKGNPVQVLGFDPSFSGGTFTDEFEKELKKINILSEVEKRDFLKNLKKTNITNLAALFRNNKKVKLKITAYSEKILNDYEPKTREGFFFSQALRNMLYRFGSNETDESRSNLRDLGMASNLRFIQEQFPGEKIILFGSSTHLLKDPKAIHTSFFQKDRKTVGQQISERGNYFFIAYTALSGSKSNAFNNPKPLPTLMEDSVENTIKGEPGSSVVFITEKSHALELPVNSRFLGHSFLSLDIWRVMDGLVLIEDIKPFKIKAVEK